MGRTRRRGPRPPLACTNIQYETLERFKTLKRHKDEPLYEVYDRACTTLEEQTDINEIRTNIGKLQKKVTANGTALSLFIEDAPPEQLQSYFNKHRNQLSDDIISDIKKKLTATLPQP